MVDILKDQDYFFKHKIYSLRLEFGETDSLEVKKGKAYKLLKNIFLRPYNERKIRSESGRRIWIYDYEVIIFNPDANYALNINFPKSFSREYEYDGSTPIPVFIISQFEDY